MADFKKKINIIYLVLFILSVITAGIMADLFCYHCVHHLCENQFIDATIYGYLIVGCVLFVAVFLDDEVPKLLIYIICGAGIVLYLVTGILLFMFYLDLGKYVSDLSKIRVILGGVFSIGISIVYILLLVFTLKDKGDI